MVKHRAVLLNGLKSLSLWKLRQLIGARDDFAIQCHLTPPSKMADYLIYHMARKECSIAVEAGLLSYLKERGVDIGIDLSLLEKIADTFTVKEIKIFRCFAASGIWL